MHKGNKVTIGSLIILTNKRTAGGSEIVASSLQDHGRALIIGSTTLMRGSIQTVFPLADGSAIRLTTAYWQRSSGAPIENLGVVPDIAIDIQNQKMITELEQDDAVRLACQILDKSVSSKIDDLKAAAQGLIQGSN